MLNLIVPTMPSRAGNWPTLRRNFEECRDRAGGQVNWIVVIYTDEWAKVSAADKRILEADGAVLLVITPPSDGFMPCLYKLNAGLDWLAAGGAVGTGSNPVPISGSRVERDPTRQWCYFGADDDLVPRSLGVRVADVARREPDAQVIVCSCQRGQRAVMTGYPTWPLIAEPGNMVPCAVTGSQAIVRLDAFAALPPGQDVAHPEAPRERLRFRSHAIADGEMIQWLHRRVANRFHYLRDYYLPFNALEAQRWDADALERVLAAE